MACRKEVTNHLTFFGPQAEMKVLEDFDALCNTRSRRRAERALATFSFVRFFWGVTAQGHLGGFLVVDVGGWHVIPHGSDEPLTPPQAQVPGGERRRGGARHMQGPGDHAP